MKDILLFSFLLLAYWNFLNGGETTKGTTLGKLPEIVVLNIMIS